jgi:hypothetical protein
MLPVRKGMKASSSTNGLLILEIGARGCTKTQLTWV